MPVRNGSRRAASQQITEEQFAEAIRWLDPLPSPARRWEQAARLAKLKRSQRHCDNPDVAAAAEYLAALACCTTGKQRAAVQQRWPEISQASAIFQASDPARWRLEAWILHDFTDREIAARCELTPGIVRIYANLFFAMRDYLHRPEDLAQKLFGAAINLSFRNDELARLWHYLGLAAPTADLVQFVDSFIAAWQPGTPPTLSVYLSETAPVPLDMQALVAQYFLANNAKAAPVHAHWRFALIAAVREPDPKRQQEMKDDLQRTQIEYARGLLAGKSERQLRRLLRQPPKRLQERKSVARVQEQSMESSSTMPTTRASVAEQIVAQEIDRLLLPPEFDIQQLRAGSNQAR
jgi:hypothetical protein